VCWAPPFGGGSFCREARLLGRSGGGDRSVGEACVDGEKCRSGLCYAGACVDVCCVDNDCVPDGGACGLRVKVVSTGANWSCAPEHTERRPFLDPCELDGECESNLCIEISGEMRCSEPCCKSDACPSYVVSGFPGFLACDDVIHKGSLVRACSRWLPESATGAIGAGCEDDSECRGGRCAALGEAGERICTDVCCVDASCGDPTRFGCRPSASVGNYALRCEPK
jgi:hypothetical protein